MFRIDKQTGNVYILEGKNGETVMKKDDGSETIIPDPRDWVVGAAYLSVLFKLTIQRIYQLRDLGVLTPEPKKDHREEVYNLHFAIQDIIQYKRFGRHGVFTGGELRTIKKSDGDPFDFSDYEIDLDS